MTREVEVFITYAYKDAMMFFTSSVTSSLLPKEEVQPKLPYIYICVYKCNLGDFSDLS